jgi:putative ABC transport system permease protein
MLSNYLKIAWRSLARNQSSSFINIGGLAVGMAVAMLIGFWIYDEWSFDRQHGNYHRIAQVMENQTINGSVGTQKVIPIPVAAELTTKFKNDFKKVVLSSQTQNHILSFKEKKLTTEGNFIEPQGPEMLTIHMLSGSRNGLKDPYSILLSSTLAKALFAGADPMGRTIRMDDSLSVRVTGVYEDIPYNSSFRDISFLSPWDLYVHADAETRGASQQWEDNGWQVFVQLADNADMEKVSARIRNIKADNDKVVRYTDRNKPTMFLFPMTRWHLYSDYRGGVNVGGRIQYVRLFSIIGIFVLLLACINFMNLSTARSEKRAREVGIRKAIGSLRSQLIAQFFSESLLVSTLAFCISLGLVQLLLPFFNELADKKISIPWSNPLLWMVGVGFSLLTGLIAGSYPALYLSSFQPVKVLKGVFRAGRLASLQRKVLVVTQFTVSIALIIGTVIVFRQVQFARNRPIGYSRDGLIMMDLHTSEIYRHFPAFRGELLNTGAIAEVALSTSPTTEMRNEQGNFSWKGKDPNGTDNFATEGVTQQYAETVGLQFTQGRNFLSGPKGSDAFRMILSESAVKHMGFSNPVGENIVWYGYTFTVIGVVKDMVMESPYAAVVPTVFYTAPFQMNVLNIRINPNLGAADALKKIGTVFSKYNPSEPFDFKFVDDEYDAKFRSEQRIGKLASFFAILAVFISCLGLFGLASFVAEQRTKEIGVRKVLGATVFNLWKMLSRDFVALIVLSCLIAIPLAYYFLHQWLQQYEYRTEISWWIFAAASLGAILITLLTVSYQSIRAALANPVRSLRTE